MKKLLITLSFAICFPARAENVILMIGDGMGVNHVECLERDKDVFMVMMPVEGRVETASANNQVTDSAAAATAYACGVKTNNGYLGMTDYKMPCKTLAETSVDKGYHVGLYSTDTAAGATVAAFFTHTESRNDQQAINKAFHKIKNEMDVGPEMYNLASELPRLLDQARAKNMPFFIMVEGHHIDTYSHENNLDGMKKALTDFDRAVKVAWDFTMRNAKTTTLIVLADHETGGLNSSCQFTTDKHTSANVPLFAAGKNSSQFQGTHENTAIHAMIHKLLFGSQEVP